MPLYSTRKKHCSYDEEPDEKRGAADSVSGDSGVDPDELQGDSDDRRRGREKAQIFRPPSTGSAPRLPGDSPATEKPILPVTHRREAVNSVMESTVVSTSTPGPNTASATRKRRKPL